MTRNTYDNLAISFGNTPLVRLNRVTDGARATVCALKAYDSIRENRPVAIDPAEYGA